MPRYPLPWEEGGDTQYSQSDPPVFVYPDSFQDRVKSRFNGIRYSSNFGPVLGIIGIVIAFCVIIWFFWFMFFRTVEHDASIGQMRWERQIEIEQFRTIQDRDWRGQEPDDARIYDERREIHHYDRVLDHYRPEFYNCGTYDKPQTCYRQVAVYRDEPVYRTRYYYEVDRWVTDYWVTAKSVELQPFWPELPDGLDTRKILGNRRQGDAKKQHYEMDVHCHECDPSVIELNHNSWNDYKPGQKVIAYVTVTGHVRGVSIINPVP
jgi:hypothetical protein